MTKARNPRDFSEIPLTPNNYARLERIAHQVLNRGGQLPPDLIRWQQAAEQHYGSMSYAQQQAALAELNQARVVAERFDRVTDQAIGRHQADQFFRDRSRGLGGEFEGVDAKRLREIAENPVTVTEKRIARRTENGATVADPYTKRTVYDTDRTETRKYSDSDARRAALVLAFGKHEAESMSRGGESISGMHDEIPDYKLNDTVHAGGDVARAMLEVETKAAVGDSLPTSEYRSLDKGPHE